MTIRFDPGMIRAVAGAVGDAVSRVRTIKANNASSGGNSGFTTSDAIARLNDELNGEVDELSESVQSDSDALYATASSYTHTEDEATGASSSFFKEV